MRTRLIVTLSLITLAVFGFGNIAFGQNEVTESVTTSYYGTSKIIALGPDRAYVTWESFGVVVSDVGKGLFNNATIRCAGAYLVDKGVWESEGYVAYTLPDGEKVFVRSLGFPKKNSDSPLCPTAGLSTEAKAEKS